MKPIVTAGVGLALVVGVFMFVNGAAGLYRDPGMGWLFPTFATLMQLAALIWGLRKTAAAGRRYGGQLVAGLLISLVAGLLIIPISLGWTAAYPDVFEIMEGLQADQFADQGMTAEEIEQTLEMTAFMRTAIGQALLGFVMTMITGLVLSLIIAGFVRSKE